MNLVAILPYIQIILAILIIAVILLQRSDANAGGAFGASDNWNAAYHTRRGFEKTIFNITIILGILFVITSLAALLIK